MQSLLWYRCLVERIWLQINGQKKVHRTKLTYRPVLLQKSASKSSYLVLISPGKNYPNLCLGPKVSPQKLPLKYGPEPVLTLGSNLWSSYLAPEETGREFHFPSQSTEPTLSCTYKGKKLVFGAPPDTPVSSPASPPHYYILTLSLASFRNIPDTKPLTFLPGPCSALNFSLGKAWPHPAAPGGKSWVHPGAGCPQTHTSRSSNAHSFTKQNSKPKWIFSNMFGHRWKKEK